jgi:hypothetical protein
MCLCALMTYRTTFRTHNLHTKPGFNAIISSNCSPLQACTTFCKSATYALDSLAHNKTRLEAVV